LQAQVQSQAQVQAQLQVAAQPGLVMERERELELQRVRAEGEGPAGQPYLATARRRAPVTAPALSWVAGVVAGVVALGISRRRQPAVARVRAPERGR
jgi:hypothetical protein